MILKKSLYIARVFSEVGDFHIVNKEGSLHSSQSSFKKMVISLKNIL